MRSLTSSKGGGHERFLSAIEGRGGKGTPSAVHSGRYIRGRLARTRVEGNVQQGGEGPLSPAETGWRRVEQQTFEPPPGRNKVPLEHKACCRREPLLTTDGSANSGALRKKSQGGPREPIERPKLNKSDGTKRPGTITGKKSKKSCSGQKHGKKKPVIGAPKKGVMETWKKKNG